LLGLLAPTACVATATYNARVAELQAQREQRDRASAGREKALQREVDERGSQVRQLDARRAGLEKQLTEVDARLREVAAERDLLRMSQDESAALASEQKKRLEKQAQNVEQLTTEKDELAHALEESRGRVDELRRQKVASDALAATFRNLVLQFKPMVDSAALKVLVRDGRLLIAMPNDALFDSGREEIRRDAQVALGKVAAILAKIANRRFLVAGHTDNVPIRTERFPSNWELSAARAVEVTRFLIAHGMRAQVLAAAGYGEYDPVVSNDSPETRALNRRIEIVLQPTVAELPFIEGAATIR
jgi:chemotaxis protein MotB